MGVFRKFVTNNSESYVINLGDITVSDDTTNDAEENELVNHLNRAVSEATGEQTNARRNRNRRLRSQQKKLTLKPEPAFSGLGCRGKSHKKYRRYENANLLPLSMPEFDEDELHEISIYDFVPQTVSVFAQFLMDKNNLKAWNDFIECSEEEQQAILKDIKQRETVEYEDENDENGNVKKGRKRGKSSSKDYFKSRVNLNNMQSDDVNKNSHDERRKHPAYSSEKCFERIDLNIKHMLKKKHIPLNLLQRIEQEIIDFFSKEPFSIYKSCLPSGYERLLLHACCQYLDLTCKSFDQNGARWSKVQNPNHYFIPPLINLSNYLETHSVRKYS